MYLFVGNQCCKRELVTLSSSEAEYVAMSEVVKEFKLIYYLLYYIGIEVDLPIILKTENFGAVFMAQNRSSSMRI
jgi:ketol-acid reductoisomerase